MRSSIPSSVRVFVRGGALLARLAPPRLRAELEADGLLVLEDVCARAHRRGGPRALFRTGLAEWFNLIATAWRARRRSAGEDAAAVVKCRRWRRVPSRPRSGGAIAAHGPRHHRPGRADARARHRREHRRVQHPRLAVVPARAVRRRRSARRPLELLRAREVHDARTVQSRAHRRMAQADRSLRSRRRRRREVVHLRQRPRRRDDFRQRRHLRAVLDARRRAEDGSHLSRRRRPRRHQRDRDRQRALLAVAARARPWRRRPGDPARRRAIRDRRRHAADVPLPGGITRHLAADRRRRAATGIAARQPGGHCQGARRAAEG